MLKTLGAVCIMLCASWIGFTIARKYRERPKQLQQLRIALKMLETDISYHALPLPAALRNVGKRVAKPVANIFLITADRLEEGDGKTLAELWSETINELLQNTSLLHTDAELLRQFGLTLGTSDRENQLQHIHGVSEMLQIAEEQARDEQQRLEKMWKYLGPVTGVILVILLY